MATNLSNIFGSEITVTAQPRQADIQYNGIAGANGLLSMHLGTRGRPIIVTGILRVSGESYSVARAALRTLIDDIEAYTQPGAEPDSYTWQGETFQNVIFEKFEITGQRNFGYTSANYCICNFRCILRELL